MIAKQSIGKSFTGALNYNIKKLHHPDPRQRAEILSTNFTNMGSILKELAMMRAMNPRLKRNTYHASLNFAIGEKISNQKMQNIADEYMKKMGFDNNLYIIFRHHDSNHPHCHILATRNRFDGTVVSDSNNYKRSEKIVRELEKKYRLQAVNSSKQSKLKAPNRDELEMIQRTKRPSKKLILQHKVREAIRQSATMQEFINHLEKQNINVLFNQASTGRVSGITYQIPGFKIRGQALGNQFKFGSIIKQINYEQSRDGQAISQANDRTRARYGGTKQSNKARHYPKTGVPFSNEWYHFAKSKGIKGLPEIPFGFIDPSQTRILRVDERAAGNEKIAKEDTGHLDHYISDYRYTASSVLGSLAGLLDVEVKMIFPVGVYEGGGYVSKGVYRPMVDCLMHSNDATFCPVCQRAIIQMIKRYTAQ